MEFVIHGLVLLFGATMAIQLRAPGRFGVELQAADSGDFGRLALRSGCDRGAIDCPVLDRAPRRSRHGARSGARVALTLLSVSFFSAAHTGAFQSPCDRSVGAVHAGLRRAAAGRWVSANDFRDERILVSCIPFFIFAGELMLHGGIADRLVAFANSLVGHVRGGLGMSTVVACTLFGGVSGSPVADVSAMGAVMIPMMKKEGYHADYAVERDHACGTRRRTDAHQP